MTDVWQMPANPLIICAKISASTTSGHCQRFENKRKQSQFKNVVKHPITSIIGKDK